MTRDEIINKINQCDNILHQYDYISRKLAFENAKLVNLLAQKLDIKIEQPVYNQYIDIETEANGLRLEINDLRKQLENADE